MTKNYKRSEEYREIAERVIDKQEDLHWIRDVGVQIDYVESSQRKVSNRKLTFAECMKVKEIYNLYTEFDFIITVYSPNVAGLTEEQKEILMYHELLHVGVHESNAGELVYVTNPHDVEDFKVVLEKYGLDWASTQN